MATKEHLTMAEIMFAPLLFILGLLGIGALSRGKSKALNQAKDVIMSTPPTVEQWRPYVEKLIRGFGMHPDGSPIIPIPFVMQWITMESGGNPCAVGRPGETDQKGQVLESGLFQLMSPHDIALAATSVPEMRACCGPVSTNRFTTQACLRDLTEQEKLRQIQVGLTYIFECEKLVDAAMHATGTNWSKTSNDYWMAIKSHHAGPSLMNPGLAMATRKLGHPPANWGEYQEALLASIDPKNVPGFQSLLSNSFRCGLAAFPKAGA
jgi:hypothetical protein